MLHLGTRNVSIYDFEGMIKLIYLALEVERVSWFKARARYERWREELQMVKHEMFWTTLWFKHHVSEWERRRNGAQNAGHRAYAARQKNIWEKFRKRAEESFGTLMTVVGN